MVSNTAALILGLVYPPSLPWDRLMLSPLPQERTGPFSRLQEWGCGTQGLGPEQEGLCHTPKDSRTQQAGSPGGGSVGQVRALLTACHSNGSPLSVPLPRSRPLAWSYPWCHLFMMESADSEKTEEGWVVSVGLQGWGCHLPAAHSSVRRGLWGQHTGCKEQAGCVFLQAVQGQAC